MTVETNEEPWRVNDGTPQIGLVEWRDRAMRRGTGHGGRLVWRLLGHSDDITHWRPARPRSLGYA